VKQPCAHRDTAGKELAEVNAPALAASSAVIDASKAQSANEAASGRSAEVRGRADAVSGAHRVLMCCRPGTSLPTDLAKLRAMLDAHMFGRDRRELRDDAVRVAWQIDSIHSSRGR
jgi:hypothetical protein